MRAAAAAALCLSGCTAYQARPQDPVAILGELRLAPLPERPAGAEPAGLTATEAAAWAVTWNPALRALRAGLGVADAALVEAGLLPDPEVSFDAMDALAVGLTGGTPTTRDYLAGLGLSWRVPRPGEIGARVGVATALRDEVRHGVLAAEWRLVHDVHGACFEVRAARERLALNELALSIAARTATFFRQAREAGAATAIQQNLAETELAGLEEERIRLEGALRRARQALNALLGVAPDAELVLREAGDPFGSDDAGDVDAERLAEAAMRGRPDLEALLARYRAAEEALRLEVARQWPGLSIGTVFTLGLPIFTRFNAPAIQAAAARREQLARELRAAVHALRAQAHAAVSALADARRQVLSFETSLLPRLEESLRLTDEAFSARQVTLVEILAAQRQVIDVRRRYLDARLDRARARLEVDTVTGRVLLDDAGAKPGEDDHGDRDHDDHGERGDLGERGERGDLGERGERGDLGERGERDERGDDGERDQYGDDYDQKDGR